MVATFLMLGFTLRDLESLPFGVALPIRDAIYHCRQQPASDWPEAVCLLIGRQDLSKQACEGNLPKCKAVSITRKGRGILQNNLFNSDACDDFP